MSIARRLVLAATVVSALSGTTPAIARSPTGLNHLHPGKPTSPPIGWIQFCAQFSRDCTPSNEIGKTAILTIDRLRELDSVNRFFNRSIEPITDQVQYGVTENWTYAITGKGDCEEYVLEKRRRLIQLGWPPSSLLITVVIDKQNGGHAVLTVVTDRAELVLDNVVDDVLPWSSTGLLFVKRQSRHNPNEWIDLGRVVGSPDLITAAVQR